MCVRVIEYVSRQIKSVVEKTGAEGVERKSETCPNVFAAARRKVPGAMRKLRLKNSGVFILSSFPLCV